MRCSKLCLLPFTFSPLSSLATQIRVDDSQNRVDDHVNKREKYDDHEDSASCHTLLAIPYDSLAAQQSTKTLYSLSISLGWRIDVGLTVLYFGKNSSTVIKLLSCSVSLTSFSSPGIKYPATSALFFPDFSPTVHQFVIFP